MKIKEILTSHNGVTLALTDAGTYLVGIGYMIGMEINQLNPHVDFCETPNLEIAKQQFSARSE